MRLRRFRIRAFRCIHDSGDVTVGDLAAFVGRNESGKTTILQGLILLNRDEIVSELDLCDEMVEELKSEIKVAEGVFELNEHEREFVKEKFPSLDIKRLKIIQEQIHENFISYVKNRRGLKIKKNQETEIFSGLFWVGQKAIDLGLADEIGSIYEIIKQRFGKKAKIKIIDQKKSFIQRRLSSSLPNSIIDTDRVIEKLEEKALWSRYGL